MIGSTGNAGLELVGLERVVIPERRSFEGQKVMIIRAHVLLVAGRQPSVDVVLTQNLLVIYDFGR